MDEQHLLEISWGTILKLATAFFCFYLIFLIKDILILSLFGLVISILFEVPIRRLAKKVPRGLAVAFLYVLVFSILVFLIYLPASRIVSEIRNFIKLFPVYFEELSPPLRGLGLEAFKDIESFVDMLERLVQMMTSNILNVLFSIFGGIASTIFVVSVAIFLSLEGKTIEDNIILFFSQSDKKFVRALWRRCQKKVGLWFVKTIMGCLFVGLSSYLGFLVLGVNYPLSLAAMGGAFNFVPNLGAALASFLIFIILSLDSVSAALFALVIYIIVQQIENNIISPLLSKKLVGLSPTLVLIGLAAGGKLFGIIGAILTVPLLGIIVEFGRGLLQKKREAEAEAKAEAEAIV